MNEPSSKYAACHPLRDHLHLGVQQHSGQPPGGNLVPHVPRRGRMVTGVCPGYCIWGRAFGQATPGSQQLAPSAAASLRFEITSGGVPYTPAVAHGVGGFRFPRSPACGYKIGGDLEVGEMAGRPPPRSRHREHPRSQKRRMPRAGYASLLTHASSGTLTAGFSSVCDSSFVCRVVRSLTEVGSIDRADVAPDLGHRLGRPNWQRAGSVQ